MSANDEVLLSLFINLRNAAATFGSDSAQYQTIQGTVYEHLRSMQDAGQKTNVTDAKRLADQTGLAADLAKLGLGSSGS
ncbi:hypothetical protein M8818_001033 [Zalaria obscura]|uniref:Uncharacterized protein n=1 Tax=Zalaria obscura TaxID=2024903 RepID=A0ACC3SLX8_9PEZI